MESPSHFSCSSGDRPWSPQTNGSLLSLRGLPPPGFGICSLMDQVLQFGPPITATIRPSCAAVIKELYGSFSNMSWDLDLRVSNETAWNDRAGHVACSAASNAVESCLPAYRKIKSFPSGK